MPSFMVPSGGGSGNITTENMIASNIKTGVTIIVKYRGKDLYKVLGTFTNDANATAADILNTKTAYVNGNKVTGSMPNIGAVSQSLAINGTYNVPKGYHNGSGRVTQSIPTQGAKTITPNTGDQRVTAGRYLTGDITVKGDGNLVAGNIKSGVSIFGVWGNYLGEGGERALLFRENGGMWLYAPGNNWKWNGDGFTCSVSGNYHITAHSVVTDSPDGTNYLEVHVNGSIYQESKSSYYHATVDFTKWFDPGNTISLWVRGSRGHFGSGLQIVKS